jgi:serine O-acetyltransferase
MGLVFITMSAGELTWRLERQLDAVSPRRRRGPLAAIVDRSLLRAERCFAAIAIPGYRTPAGDARFDPLHGDQFAQFVWLVANSAWQAGDPELAADAFLLNKAVNGIVCMWDTQMPEIFLWIHTVGTMLGKAEYGDRFVCYQNVTVGTDRGERPSFGTGTILFAGAKVVGGSVIGERTCVSLNSVVIGERIAADTIVAGRSPELLVKPRRRWLYRDYFADEPVDPRTRAGTP